MIGRKVLGAQVLVPDDTVWSTLRYVTLDVRQLLSSLGARTVHRGVFSELGSQGFLQHRQLSCQRRNLLFQRCQVGRHSFPPTRLRFHFDCVVPTPDSSQQGGEN